MKAKRAANQRLMEGKSNTLIESLSMTGSSHDTRSIRNRPIDTGAEQTLVFSPQHLLKEEEMLIEPTGHAAALPRPMHPNDLDNTVSTRVPDINSSIDYSLMAEYDDSKIPFRIAKTNIKNSSGFDFNRNFYRESSRSESEEECASMKNIASTNPVTVGIGFNDSNKTNNVMKPDSMIDLLGHVQNPTQTVQQVPSAASIMSTNSLSRNIGSDEETFDLLLHMFESQQQTKSEK
jgi:hypothetical protein